MTGPFRRIACAIDFSDGSREAMRLAVELARESRAALVLVHVADQPLWRDEPFVHLPGDVRKELLAAAETELAAWERAARELGATDVATKLARGAAWDRIVALAREDPAIDLVVVGTHGRTGIERALIGSVAERVVRHAPCTVLVARAQARRGS